MELYVHNILIYITENQCIRKYNEDHEISKTIKVNHKLNDILTLLCNETKNIELLLNQWVKKYPLMKLHIL